MKNEKRWRQRFENFEKSFNVFQRRIDTLEKSPEDEGYKMALIQSFEITIELSWNTLKDYMESQGLNCNSFPKNIIRMAFKTDLIDSPEDWMESIDTRNKTSHTYKEDILEEVTVFIQDKFCPIVKDLYFKLKKEL